MEVMVAPQVDDKGIRTGQYHFIIQVPECSGDEAGYHGWVYVHCGMGDRMHVWQWRTQTEKERSVVLDDSA